MKISVVKFDVRYHLRESSPSHPYMAQNPLGDFSRPCCSCTTL